MDVNRPGRQNFNQAIACPITARDITADKTRMLRSARQGRGVAKASFRNKSRHCRDIVSITKLLLFRFLDSWVHLFDRRSVTHIASNLPHVVEFVC